MIKRESYKRNIRNERERKKKKKKEQERKQIKRKGNTYIRERKLNISI